MKKKVIKKPKTQIPYATSYHIVYYVVNSTPGMQKFHCLEDMETFFKEFKSQFPNNVDSSGTYLDFCITNIYGEIKFL